MYVNTLVSDVIEPRSKKLFKEMKQGWPNNLCLLKIVQSFITVHKQHNKHL